MFVQLTQENVVDGNAWTFQEPIQEVVEKESTFGEATTNLPSNIVEITVAKVIDSQTEKVHWK